MLIQGGMVMIIPLSRGLSQSQYDGANQSQSIKKSSEQDDTRFFIEVHLFASKLVLVVAIHTLIDITRQTHN